MINDWLIVFISMNATPKLSTLGTGLSVLQRGLSLWQPAVPPVDAGPSHWQLLPVLVSIPHDEYTRIAILAHWP